MGGGLQPRAKNTSWVIKTTTVLMVVADTEPVFSAHEDVGSGPQDRKSGAGGKRGRNRRKICKRLKKNRREDTERETEEEEEGRGNGRRIRSENHP